MNYIEKSLSFYNWLLLFPFFSNGPKRVVDVTNHSPISAASIFDAEGNMVGFTWSDGTFSDIPESGHFCFCIPYHEWQKQEYLAELQLWHAFCC